ncbi:MAG: dTDP-glucose 4,6-dehydratase, dTDP-glucose 4,6-dehydratase [Parcubacteria group bacterium GW2011_GWC1_43_11]|uniref:dTDP-glucose 4,6-dehydratase n=1 Tax=Candidatus Woesebacteria bacterium GW2011_GWA1_41_13b TaxID=1618555 RepID=A0A0G0X630_9BACT|nr:MAG: dTDP-glucose 4,6-dehydratase [Candidatus Woesebacteria bacterium GW2011_GWA1_41_13b]KKS87913.1 MAG: dTDP-glucose 4,6-dehydratase, dTDP-glucose 4,6-dehydratase [Parcubacteria group bacterium GW2011_GWC1_43_11]
MKVLVTGGAGFIGSNFIQYWFTNHPKDEIVNLDKLTYAGHLSSLKNLPKSSEYRFIKGDICDGKTVDSAMKGIDIVVHFAAETHVDRSLLDPAAFIKTNFLGTQVLLEAALRHEVKRFHHISTDEVYGELPLNSWRKFNEESPIAPRSPYSASKAGAELLVKAYVQSFDLPATITNCSNNYGPFQDPEKFIPRMITNIIDGGKIPIYGDGKYTRDWLYVDDHSRAIESVILKGKSGETYCVGGMTDDISNLEVARLVLKIMDKDQSNIEFVKDRLGHDRKYAVDWSKIKKELGWSPSVNFEKGLIKTIRWYQENQWWWRPLKKRAESIYK